MYLLLALGHAICAGLYAVAAARERQVSRLVVRTMHRVEPPAGQGQGQERSEPDGESQDGPASEPAGESPKPPAGRGKRGPRNRGK